MKEMQQLENFGDQRQVAWCGYCGGRPETFGEVPSRAFLDEPYPDNLPNVPACRQFLGAPTSMLVTICRTRAARNPVAGESAAGICASILAGVAGASRYVTSLLAKNFF